MSRSRETKMCGVRFAVGCVVLLLCSALHGGLRAQDVLPLRIPPSVSMNSSDSCPVLRPMEDSVPVPALVLPAAFRQVGTNELSDSLGILRPFWKKLRHLHLGLSTDTLRVLHIGDSHIRGHLFPQTIGQLMQHTFGAVSYMDMGINGASCVTFTHPDRMAQVAALHPDLLILSFGTNESHNRRYTPLLHYRQMDDLVRMLRDSLPGVPMLMTAPPGSYDGFRHRRRRTYKVNPRTAIAVRTICRFADDNGLAIWNLYDIVGGIRRACFNWQEAGLMRPDHVHYTPEGYLLQGKLLHQALIKAYNDYVEH